MSITDKELYKQKFQALLDERKADIDKLKARVTSAKADAELDLNKLIDGLDHQLKAASTKLTELSNASEGAWDSAKKSAESSWESLKVAIHEAMEKIKE